MTDPDASAAFDTLIYTDCRPGQGLRGEVGLQFQARSAGADKAAMALVQRNLLYEPPAKWMSEQRPVDAYPPSFAHMAGDYLATAAGVYLGKEVNGGREGNSLTHSIVTTSPQTYGPVRPAQLFRAPFWVTEPAPTTKSPMIAPGWQPGPFGVDEAKEFVLSNPGSEDLLVSLVSALERIGTDESRRILFISTDPAEVLKWIVVGTLLLPLKQALSIGFKVFTTDPVGASQPVVAVHPDWNATAARVGNDLGYVVFDLVAFDWTKLKPTPNAPSWVRLFYEEDPYDVVDAIEVAAGSELKESDAPVFGRTAVLRFPVTEEAAEILVNWLRDSEPSLLAAYRDTIVDMLTESVDKWPQRILLTLDEVSRSGQVPASRVQPIRLALIKAELFRASREGKASSVELPPLPSDLWQREQREAARRLVVDAVLDAPTSSFDAILRLAKRFGIEVKVDDISDAVDRFVLDWAERPRPYDIALWPCGRQIDGRLADELSMRIHAGDEQAKLIGDDWWSMRVPRVNQIFTALDHVVVGAAIRHFEPEQRAELVDRLLTGSLADPEPSVATGKIVNALWSRVAPTYAEMQMLAEQLPDGTQVDRKIFGRLETDLQEGTLSRKMLSLAHRLSTLGALRPSAATARLLTADDTLLDIVARLTRAEPFDATAPPPERSFGTLPKRLLEVRSQQVADALVRTQSPVTVLDVLLVAGRHVVEKYSALLIRELLDTGGAEHVAATFYIGYASRIPVEFENDLVQALSRWMNRANAKQMKEAAGRIGLLGADWAAHWHDVVASARGGNPAVRFKRRVVG